MISLIIGFQLILANMSNPPDVACFSLNEYTSYCGPLLEFKHTDRGIELTVEVDTETWEFVDMLMLFNLYWDKRNPGQVSGTKPVQISMFLDRELYAKLESSGELLTDKSAFIQAGAMHPMRAVTAWFATEVTEEVELPDELKKMGTVREGFTTHWRDSK